MFYIFIILSRTFSALGLFLIRGRESVSPNRVDEMRNHREPPYSIRRQVRMSCSCLFSLSLDPLILLPFYLSRLSFDGYVVARFIDTCRKIRISLFVPDNYAHVGPRGFTATATGGRRRSSFSSFFLFRHKDFSYVNEGKIKITWQFVEYKICLKKSFLFRFFSLNEFFFFPFFFIIKNSLINELSSLLINFNVEVHFVTRS